MIKYWIREKDGRWRYGAAPHAPYFGDIILTDYHGEVGTRVYLEWVPLEENNSYELYSDTAPEGAPVFDK